MNENLTIVHPLADSGRWEDEAVTKAQAVVRKAIFGDTVALNPQAVMTPSEALYLNAVLTVPVPDSPRDLPELYWSDGALGWSYGGVEALVATAFLAMETKGELQLDVVEKPWGFGLFSRQVLVAKATEANGWPVGTLERALYVHLAMRGDVKSAVAAWLGQDFANPHRAGDAMVRSYVVVRGWLRQETTAVVKHFLCFSWQSVKTSYAATNAARDVARQPNPSPLELLARCRNERPQLYSALQREIGSGFNLRTEDSD